jgi:nucleotide-binding universal stress UspA family protein
MLGDVPRRALGEAIARAKEVAPDLLVDADLLTGPPALAITDSGCGALVLAVGARGAGGFAAMLLGSVSRYAAMNAACPVAVVREETGVVHREVVAGIRDPHDTTATLPFAFEEAALRGATLVVVHAWHFPADPGKVPADIGQNLAGTLRTWREKYPDVAVREDIVHGHPARVLASYTARADLVVIGRHGGHDTGPAIGAVQHGVLNHAHGPVVVVPAKS